jgi:hypothetical protein
MACWITKAAERHSEYITLTVLPQQQWLKRMLLNFKLQNTEHFTIRIRKNVPSILAIEVPVDSKKKS